MKNYFCIGVLGSVVILSSLGTARHKERAVRSDGSSAIPEMSRLAKALVGDWNTTETRERSEFFPDGGGRHGTSHWKLGVNGTTLIGEGHSNGSAGALSYLIVIWWDTNAKFYHYLTCFNDDKNPCTERGTARWEGDVFINDYEEVVNGEKRTFRDSFVEITPKSHTLLAAVRMSDGTMKTLITSKSVRR